MVGFVKKTLDLQVQSLKLRSHSLDRFEEIEHKKLGFKRNKYGEEVILSLWPTLNSFTHRMTCSFIKGTQCQLFGVHV